MKVNTYVDAGIADLVTALSTVDGLETIASCQGDIGLCDAYVYFYYRDWETLSKFAFKEIASVLHGIEGTSISVEIFNGSVPMGKLTARDALSQITDAVTSMLSHRKSEYFGGRGHTKPDETPPPDPENNGGGSGGGGSGYHPFIQGLLDSLPQPKSQWAVSEQAKWLQTAANIFGLIYKGEGNITVKLNNETTDNESPETVND